MRILVTTDNHVGYKEEHQTRCFDSICTFDEALQIAQVAEVDFVIQCGDLFHDMRPSRHWINSVMASLSSYQRSRGCLPDAIELLVPISTGGRVVEFSPVKSSIPRFFTIHGNHDDPGSELASTVPLCAADVLHTAGLAYYLKTRDIEEGEIIVDPVLLIASDVCVAIYSLGYVKDERMRRLFETKKVRYRDVSSNPACAGRSVFHLGLIHQNRFKGDSKDGAPAKSCIFESFLPSFLHLVLWGHEHECIPQTVQCAANSVHVLQPGSTVATSLIAAEARQKSVFILEVASGPQFRLSPVSLLTVRPLIFRETTITGDQHTEDLIDNLRNIVQELATEGKQQCADQALKRTAFLTTYSLKANFQAVSPELPLVRLKVKFEASNDGSSDEVHRNMKQLAIALKSACASFKGQIANYSDCIVVNSKPNKSSTRQVVESMPQLVSDMFAKRKRDDSSLSSAIVPRNQTGGAIDAESALIAHASKHCAGRLKVLDVEALSTAVVDFVEKQDSTAFQRYIASVVDRANPSRAPREA